MRAMNLVGRASACAFTTTERILGWIQTNYQSHKVATLSAYASSHLHSKNSFSYLLIFIESEEEDQAVDPIITTVPTTVLGSD